VRIDYADWFAKPMRLSPTEAVALLAAGTLLLQAGDDEYASGPLLRGVAKLAGALGAGGEGAVDVQLGAASEETLALLRTAVAQRRCVELDYYSYGRDARHVRVVEPHRFFVDDG